MFEEYRRICGATKEINNKKMLSPGENVGSSVQVIFITCTSSEVTMVVKLL